MVVNCRNFIKKITIQKGVTGIYDAWRGVIGIIQMSSNRLFPLMIESAQSCLVVEESSIEKHGFGTFVMDLWAFALWWIEDSSIEKHEEWTSQISISPSLWRMCCQQAVPFSISTRKIMECQNALELVLLGICGQINPVSNGGKRYSITSIDDYAKKNTWT